MQVENLDHNEYYVEKILEKKIIKGEIKYLIKWDGWPIEDSTWEPLSNLGNIKNLIEIFEKERAIKNSKPKQRRRRRRRNMIKNINNSNNNVSSELESIIIYDLKDDVPIEILSVKKGNEGILALVRFETRSDGIEPCDKYVPTYILRELYPKVLINFYESKIKFVEKQIN